MSASTGVLLSGGAIIDLDGTIFVQLAIFLFLMIALRSLVFRPLMALFDAREAASEGAQKEAQQLQAQASEAASAFDARLDQMRAEAGKERDKLRQEGRQIEQSLLEKVQAEIEVRRRDACESLRRDAIALRAELESKRTSLASEIASKLLGREVKG